MSAFDPFQTFDRRQLRATSCHSRLTHLRGKKPLVRLWGYGSFG
jgi:hypothetical protein